MAQSSAENSIEKTIQNYSIAGDKYDTDLLDSYLDPNFRIIMNRLFGSDEVLVMSKADYLQKIKSKDFGGDSRKIQIESITMNGTTACAKVSFVGSKMTFVSILSLIKDSEGKWKLISDLPVVI